MVSEMRAAVTAQHRPGVWVFAAHSDHGLVGKLWLSATAEARAGILGRHSAVDVPLRADAELSLRQVLFVVRQLPSGVRFTVVDLDTPNGLATSSGATTHLLESTQPLSVRSGLTSFFCWPTGPGSCMPSDAVETWAAFESTNPVHCDESRFSPLLRNNEPRAEGLVRVRRRQSYESYLIGRRALSRGVLLGRDERCGIRFSDDSVSRVHAVLLNVDGRTHIIDAGSSNGTWIFGREISCRPLYRGDCISLAHAYFRWEAQ